VNVRVGRRFLQECRGASPPRTVAAAGRDHGPQGQDHHSSASGEIPRRSSLPGTSTPVKSRPGHYPGPSLNQLSGSSGLTEPGITARPNPALQRTRFARR